jgi:hypothetical protein
MRVMEGWRNRRDDEPGGNLVLVAEFRGFKLPSIPTNRHWAQRLWLKAWSEQLRPRVRLAR